MTLWSEQVSSLYKIRSVSDLPEQEEACVLVME